MDGFKSMILGCTRQDHSGLCHVANNEIGTIQPVKEIGSVAGKGVFFFILMLFRRSEISALM